MFRNILKIFNLFTNNNIHFSIPSLPSLLDKDCNNKENVEWIENFSAISNSRKQNLQITDGYKGFYQCVKNKVYQSCSSIANYTQKYIYKTISMFSNIPSLAKKGIDNIIDEISYKIYKKIDAVAEEIKINTKFSSFISIFWMVIIYLGGSLLTEIIAYTRNIPFRKVLDIIVAAFTLKQPEISLNLEDILNLITAITMVILFIFIVCFLIKDIHGVISLQQTENTKKEIDSFVINNECDELKKYLLSLDLSKKYHEKLEKKLQCMHNTTDVIYCFERTVLTDYDNEVHKIICNYRNKVIVGNGVSGSSILDFIVNLYCFYQILRETAKIYHIKLGITSVFKILGAGCLVCYAVSKTTNILGGVFEQLLNGAKLFEGLHNLFVYPIKILVQSITSGFSMQIYGYWLKYALRPLKPYDKIMKEKTKQVLKSKDAKESSLNQ